MTFTTPILTLLDEKKKALKKLNLKFISQFDIGNVTFTGIENIKRCSMIQSLLLIFALGF